jgi:GNAT superfamily N-acetyltransferase
MNHRIEAVSTHPDLAPLVANWLVAEFGYPGGRTVDEVAADMLGPTRGPEETFVLFDQDRPVGTASLAHDDLKSRRDLTPWLAGVFVDPSARGLGYASALVRHVEAFAAAHSVPTLWLYTWTAAPLYARLGWQHMAFLTDRGREVVLMTRQLSSDPP